MHRIAGACVVVMFLALGGQAAAQTKPIRGNWNMTFNVPGLGTFPVPMTFRKRGKGTISLATAKLPLVYREIGASVSATAEVDGANSPSSAGFTLVLRATKTTDNTIMGKLILTTDTADGSAIGFMQMPGTVTGQRQ